MSFDLQDPNTAQLFLRWTKGNQDAARLILQFCQWAREVDDIVDEECDVGECDTQRRVTTIVELSLIHIAGNPFYQRFHGQLTSVVIEMLAYWRLGDEFRESGDEKKQMFGFVLRESTDRLALVIAGILGGSDHALDVARELYELTHAKSEETVEEWVHGNSGEKQDGSIR